MILMCVCVCGGGWVLEFTVGRMQLLGHGFDTPDVKHT